MKVYTRTESGTATEVSVKDGLAEINHAMMAGKRDVREMSSITRTDFAIEYKDGRKITLVQSEAPEAAPEPEDWASTAKGNIEHRFGSDGRALCNRRYRAYDRPISQTDRRVRRTRSEIETGPYADQYTFCPACGAL